MMEGGAGPDAPPAENDDQKKCGRWTLEEKQLFIECKSHLI